MALYDGTVQDRYDRDLLRLEDDRKLRGFDNQNVRRREREYVDPDAVAVVGDYDSVNGTVTTTGDNSNGYSVTLDPA